MDAVATRPPGEHMEEVGCLGNYISMGFVFVGTDDTMTRYLRHLQRLKAMQVERAYIAARDDWINIAERASYLAEKRNLAKRIKSKRYYATDTLGQRREHILIEMQLVPSAPFAPPEQGQLLEE
jgi:hypothetical protein